MLAPITDFKQKSLTILVRLFLLCFILEIPFVTFNIK